MHRQAREKNDRANATLLDRISAISNSADRKLEHSKKFSDWTSNVLELNSAARSSIRPHYSKPVTLVGSMSSSNTGNGSQMAATASVASPSSTTGAAATAAVTFGASSAGEPTAAVASAASPSSSAGSPLSFDESDDEKPKIKTRAFLNLPSFLISESKELTAFLAFLTGLKTVESNPDEKQQPDATPAAIVTMVSKFLKFESTAANADEVVLFDELRDQVKVGRFMQALRNANFTFSTILKYLRAMCDCISFIAQRTLTADERSALDQTRQWFASIKKPRARAQKKEVRRRNSKEAMINDGSWMDLSMLKSISDGVALEAEKLLQTAKNAPDAVGVEESIRYRECVVFLMLVRCKIARQMLYVNLDDAEWLKLPRDDEKRKYYVSDKFKTSDSGSFSLDTVIFTADVEALIENYRLYFRPTKAKPGLFGGDALFLTRSGKRVVRLSDDVIRVVGRHSDAHAHINITSLRKMLHTSAVEKLPIEEVRLMARSDTHSDATAAAYYEKRDSVDVATRALAVQSKLINGSEAAADASEAAGAAAASNANDFPEADVVPADNKIGLPTDDLRPRKRQNTSQRVNSAAAAGADSESAPPLDGCDDTKVLASAAAAVPTAPAPSSPPDNAGITSTATQAATAGVVATPPMIDPILPAVATAASSALTATATVIVPSTPAANGVSTPTNGLFTAEMDEILVRVGNASAKVGWAALKHSNQCFSNVTSEQMRWRFRNLTKPTPAATSRPARVATNKRKYTAAGSFGGAIATPAASPAAGSRCKPNRRLLERVAGAKFIDGVMMLKVKFIGSSADQWVRKSN